MKFFYDTDCLVGEVVYFSLAYEKDAAAREERRKDERAFPRDIRAKRHLPSHIIAVIICASIDWERAFILLRHIHRQLSRRAISGRISTKSDLRYQVSSLETK
jgi:hypothetical protein